jgi:O-antigen/teichoic acid export membrane protein
LRQLIQYWSKYHSQEAFTRWRKLQVLTPYIGTLVGVCIALASALEILGLATFASYLVALLVISVVGFLVWLQIGRILSKNLVRSYLSESKELFPQK